MKTDLRPGAPAPHLPVLDGLRGLAILLVLFSHWVNDLPHRLFPYGTSGWCGVDLFFVLSGFLITNGLLASRTSINYFSSFYSKRLLRIFPVYYLALLAYFILLPLCLPGMPRPDAYDRVFYWFYLNNWAAFLHLPNAPFIGHFWSLAVEEQFYLLWPVVVLLVRPRRLCHIAATCVVVAPLLRAALVLRHVTEETIDRNTFCRMDTLMLGVLCSLLLSDTLLRERLQRALPLLAASCALLLSTPWLLFGFKYQGHRMLTAGVTMLDLGCACLLLCCVLAPARFSLLQTAPLRTLGRWSYGIYVYHLGFAYMAHRLPIFGTGIQRFCLQILLAVAGAGLSYVLYEKPFLSLKAYFAPRWQNPREERITVLPYPESANAS